MKRFIIPAVAAFGLAVATPVFAAPAANAGQQSAQPAQTGIQLAQHRDRDRTRSGRPHGPSGVHSNHPQYRAGTRSVRPERPHYNWNDYRPGQRPPHWDRYHRNFNPGHWHGNIYAPRRYHWGPYRYPHGWYYRRWVYGAILPSIFWGRDYWINSYWDYGLMDPPYGYVWVRYGDDAILVNVATGVVLRVVYGIFY